MHIRQVSCKFILKFRHSAGNFKQKIPFLIILLQWVSLRLNINKSFECNLEMFTKLSVNKFNNKHFNFRKKKKRSHSLSTEETSPVKKPKQNEFINKPDKDVGKKKKKKQKSDLDVTDSTLSKIDIKLNQDEQESGPKKKNSILVDAESKTSDLDVRLSEEGTESQKTKKKKKTKLKSTEQLQNVKKHISTEQSSVEQSNIDSPEWKQISKSKKQRRKEEVKLLKREHEQLDDDSDDVSDDVVKKSKVVCTDGLIQEKINKTLKKTERLQKMNQGM